MALTIFIVSMLTPSDGFRPVAVKFPDTVLALSMLLPAPLNFYIGSSALIRVNP